MPQPMSTPTRFGHTLSLIRMVVPITQPMPGCTSGISVTLASSAKGWFISLIICDTAFGSTTSA